MVVWMSDRSSQIPTGLFGQHFTSAGGKVGDQFLIDTNAFNPGTPATTSTGMFVPWCSNGSGSSYISAQIFDFNTTWVVSGAPSSAAGTLQADSHVANFSISDVAENVVSELDTLIDDIKLTSIMLTDAGTPILSLTYAQYVNDATALAKISGSYALSVSGVPVSSAQTLQINGLVTSFSVSDLASNIMPAVSALNGYSKLSGVVVSGVGTASNVDLSVLTSPTDIALGPNNASAPVVIDGNWHVQDLGAGVFWRHLYDNGTLLGAVIDSQGHEIAAISQNGSTTILGTLGGLSSIAYDVNSNGQIVGTSQIADGSYHAFLWKEGTMYDLGTPAGTSS